LGRPHQHLNGKKMDSKAKKKKTAPQTKTEPIFEQTKATALVLKSPKTPAASPGIADQASRSKKRKTTKKKAASTLLDTPQQAPSTTKKTTTKKAKPAVVLSDSEADEFDTLLNEVDIENEVLSNSDSEDESPTKSADHATTPANSRQVVDPANIVDTRALLISNDGKEKEQEFTVLADQCLVLRGCARIRISKGEAAINGFKLGPKLTRGVEVFSEMSHVLLSVENVSGGGQSCTVCVTPISSQPTMTGTTESG